jgi:hypothetical protein
MSFFSVIRQLRFPREFRIAPSPWPANLEELLLRLFDEMTRSKPQEQIWDQQLLPFLADIGTGLWRLRHKMVKPGTNQPLVEMQRPFRHLESVWDALIQAGVDIQDHTDKPFDPGMSLKVISYQPMPGLGRERVIETIKPTIYFKGKMIQMGEVIVGRPQKDERPPAHPDQREIRETKEEEANGTNND